MKRGAEWLVLGVAACVLAGARADAADWLVQDLGIPINAVSYGNSHAVLAPGPKGQGRMFYTSYYRSTGAELVGYDYRRGVALRKKLSSGGGYAVTLGRDGCVYVGGVNPGDLYRYDPKADALTAFSAREFGVEYIWEAGLAPDGAIYCAAGYPKTNLLKLEPGAAGLRNLGELTPGVEYLRALCVDARGAVWCGIGMRAHLLVCDAGGGTRQEVLPNEYRDQSCVYDLQAVGGQVLASVLHDGVMLVYDAATRQVARTIPKPANQKGWMMASGFEGDAVYLYTIPAYDLYRCDLRDGGLTLLARALGQVHVVEADRYAHVMQDQDYLVYDLQEQRELARKRLTEGGDGMDVFTLAAGPDGNIYGSTYINMHMFRCDAATGRLTDLGKASRWPGQVDSLSLGPDGRLYLGAYIDAVVSIYDPRRPWRPGMGPEANPREIGPLGKGQYRTRANCLGPDRRIYLGSIPAYNSSDRGAFTICDPRSGAMDVRQDFVPGGAVDVLVADDRYVYGAGGGEFFAYDPAAGAKRAQIKRAVTALAAIGDGKVLGSGGRKVFIYDRQMNAIVEDRPNPAGDFTHLTVGPDHLAYAVNVGAVARIGADTAVEVLAKPGGRFAALDRQGRLYFARGPRLFRCSPPK